VTPTMTTTRRASKTQVVSSKKNTQILLSARPAELQSADRLLELRRRLYGQRSLWAVRHYDAATLDQQAILAVLATNLCC
jgi:hypothetical protein